MNKTILGLDLGTNSIGWALINQDFDNKQGKILGMGSRIIPMSQDILGEFGKGNSVSQTATRTGFRSTRRLRERHLLRRERLHRVLHILGFLPLHYDTAIDFEKHLGKFKDEQETKLVYNNNEFLFKASFNEMLEDFRIRQPQLLINQKGEPAIIPYDWTIYYLRKKALTQRIEKEELAWILLNFNQKRGYYQLRGEEDDDATRTTQTRIYFDTQIISSITDTGATYKGLKVIQITLANGDTGKYFSKEIPNWAGLQKNIIATIDLDKDGNDRYEEDGSLKRRFSIPTEEDWDKKWKLVKIKTEKEIKDSNKTVGAYIYDTLLQNPKQKIKGKLVRTIERKFYKDELKVILDKQVEFHSELQFEELYNDCVRELYRNNDAHQFQLSKKNFVHLLVEDIIFYQRPLRSQKSSIGNCSLEFHKYKNKEGIEQIQYLKAIPRSNPYYQEFRIWQWLFNLNIYRKEDECNVTSDFLNTKASWESLFDFLMARKEVSHFDVLEYLISPIVKDKFPGIKTSQISKEVRKEISKYRWNYVFDEAKEKEEEKSKKYPCNETGYLIRSRLYKVAGISDHFLTREIEQQLWHLIYSVTDKVEYEKALKSFAAKHSIDEISFVEAFRKFPPFKGEYGAYSEKAIKKLLPLMRLGKYWNWETIDIKSKNRINKLINGEFDENIKDRIREKAKEKTLETENDFQGLQEWLAKYVVYDRHAEAASIGKWESVSDLEQYLKDFKQHSLRNPIVEQVVTETLRVVKDLWSIYGKGAKDYFDEIHIELGREMKNTAEDRKRITDTVNENENTNLRIKALLVEMKSDSNVENVRSYSPMQQDILKIYEEGVLNSDIEIPEYILKISKTAQPSTSDLQRYKLWLEQKYRSPYTGAIIPLNKLFTTDYEIEHIIPQSRYFDDSFSNKVICESAVNKLKDNNLGLAFIKNFQGQIVECGFGKAVKVMTVVEYEEFVKQHYGKNRGKRNKLLLEEIPEKMIERQMNDTRYISKFISGLLSNIVRATNNDDGVNSKNIISGNGKITTVLKQDWGLNDVWNELILPRFERMNQLGNTTHFTTWNENHQKFLPTVPLELSKGFSKKRIDHRHHALDALVIACATRDHVNLLNNQSAKSDAKRYDLQHKLRRKHSYFNEKENRQKDAFKEFYKPWESFIIDAKNTLENIVVSLKQNLRVINKATNYYEKWVEKDGIKIKELQEQKGRNWAIRKPMHKDTVSGKVNLPWIKVPNGKLLTATRKLLDTSFDVKSIVSITDTGIQKILKNYLAIKDNNPEIAFSPEGIEDLNKNIHQYNNGKLHEPIYKVRVFELGSKFPLGEKGNRKSKYVETAKGTNLFFAVYANKDGRRNFESIPLNEVIERQKQGLTPVPQTNKKGDNLLFYLSPNDLVYVPTADERENLKGLDFNNLTKTKADRIYKMVSCTGGECHFVQANYSSPIIINECGTNNKNERVMQYFKESDLVEQDNRGILKPIMIKMNCIKLKVGILGSIKSFSL